MDSSPTIPEVIRVLLPNGSVKTLLLEDYLRGVTAAALPADAPLEAMKALAVAARTFAATTHRHLDQYADVCTTRHCQVWSERANPRAARAVLETRSIVAVQNGKLIDAFYFDHCDGKTRDAAGVLINPPPYLKSVPCPCGSVARKGHGIGMCQRGMLVMARLGESYAYILKHYYTGITLEALQLDKAPVALKEAATTRRTTEAERRRTEDGGRRTVDRAPSSKETATQKSASTPSKEERAESLTKEAAQADGAAQNDATKPALTGTKPVKEKAARTTSAPRRSYRKKIEQAETESRATEDASTALRAGSERRTEDEGRTTDKAPLESAKPIEPKATNAVAPPPAPMENVPPPEALVTSDNARAAEADDFLYYLAVEDVGERPLDSARGRLPTEDGGRTTEMVAPTFPQPSAAPPPLEKQEPFPIPSELSSSVVHPPSSLPPPTMPEEMPSALDLEFIAPPTSLPEPMPSGVEMEFLAPPLVQAIEPDLQEFIPPVEKFYTPLDAPPSMPEALPSFDATRRDETPISWLPPPPIEESAFHVNKPKVLMDLLPGPRIIAGSLPKPGMLVTIRDSRGNSIVTVSGVAKHYGAGGFEAPLTEDGIYAVKFDGTELTVKLENETAFIYYQ